MRTRWHRPLTVAAVLALFVATWVLRIDEAALAQVDAGWKRALATFAAARALNAVISVAQGTELAVQPAGVGVTLTPGQALDPVNDLIEQFSTLMLMASAAFGAQRVMIGIGGWWPVSLLLSGLVLAWAVVRWRDRVPPRWLSQAVIGLLVVRFMVPAVALGSEAVFQLFLKTDYQAGQQTLERSSSEIEGLNDPTATPPPDPSMADRLRRWWSQGGDVGERFEALKAVANGAVEQVVRLIVVFTMQTLVLPLVLGWALWQLARGLVLGRPRP